MISQSSFLYKKTLNRLSFMLIASLLANILVSLLYVIFSTLTFYVEDLNLRAVFEQFLEILTYLGIYSLTLLSFKLVNEDADEEFVIKSQKSAIKPNFLRVVAYVFLTLGVVSLVGWISSFVLSAFFEVSAFETVAISEINSPTVFILNVISTAVLPAIFEELIFRKVLLNKLLIYNEGFAVVISAVLFGFWHGNFYQIPYAFCAGLVLGFVYAKTRNILFTMLLHFFNNLFSLSLSVLVENMPDEVGALVEILALSIVILLGIASFIYLVLTRKKNEIQFEPTENQNYVFLSNKKLVGGVFSSGMLVFLVLCILEAVLILFNFGVIYG